jgi:HAD superfamily hydrolase (TIGR01549 family)
MIRAVIFDVGGTLIWGNGRKFERSKAWRAALLLRNLGLLPAARDFTQRLVEYRHSDPKEGPEFSQIGTTREHLRLISAEFGISVDEELLDLLELEFVQTEAAGAVGIPGMKELVMSLHGRVRLGIASNTRSDRLTREILRYQGISDLFDPIVTSVSAGYRKPSPVIYRQVLDCWDVDPAEVVMIGDSISKDVTGPQGQGTRAIWLRSQPLAAAADRHEDAEKHVPGRGQPDGIADDAAGVLALLEGWGLPDRRD